MSVSTRRDHDVQLRTDRRFEEQVFWKGLFLLVLLLVLAYVRYRWWL